MPTKSTRTPTSSAQTFLFADLAGFSALTEAHGDEEAADLVEGFFSAVRELLSDRGAEEVKTIGDAIMVRVAAPDKAIDLGLAIVEEAGSREHFPVIHVGMHTGDAVERAGDWFGAAVNVAARVSGAAGGDEVLLTGATREASGELTGIELTARGPHRFKNIGAAVPVYLAVREGRSAAELHIDPVCRMAIEDARAAGRLTHEGHQYCFCSLECAATFAADPDRYLDRGR